MDKIKLVVILVLAGLALIVILQNTASVETRFLFWSVSAPRAVLLFGTALIGFVAGVIVGLVQAKKRV